MKTNASSHWNRGGQAHYSRTLVCESPSYLGAAEGLCILIRHFLMQIRMPQHVFATELVARECLNNAIQHGNRNDQDKRIKVTIKVFEGRIRIRVADEGDGFNWRKFAAGLPASTHVSGRGLPMIAGYASRIRFNTKGNAITVDIETRIVNRGEQWPAAIG